MAQRMQIEARKSAREAGLTYVADDAPGLTRRGSGKNSFAYVDAKTGKRVGDVKVLGRIKSLVIPPAWTDVWICKSATGHLQATGRDARGRKQSRYHPLFRSTRDEAKYERVIDFAKSLPGLRARIKRDLRLDGLPRNKVLATVVTLLEKTLARIGNDEYARTNHSYGLTTIEDRHAKINGSHIRFRFVGKHGIEHDLTVDSMQLAKIVRKCQHLPQQQLFAYLDENGKMCDVKSEDVNDYLREVTGHDFTAKDFRTWAGTVLAAEALKEFEAFDNQTQAKKNVVRAIESVAKRLGNTKAVCRKCYVHPAILNSYLDGTLAHSIAKKAEKELKQVGKLKPEEAAVVTLIRGAMNKN